MENEESFEQTPIERTSGAANRPLFVGKTRYGEPKRELTLWTNADVMKSAKAPDLRGHLTLTDDQGRDNQIKVSAWFRPDENRGNRLVLMAPYPEEHLFGSVRAMVKVKGHDADGGQGLLLIGNLDVPAPDGQIYKVPVVTRMSEAFKDRPMLYDSARELGFPERMIQQFEALLTQKDARQAPQQPQAAPDEGEREVSRKTMRP